MSILALQSERLLKMHGLSEPTYNTLRILRGHRRRAEAAGDGVRAFPGAPCSVIARELVAQVPDLTRLVDRLCAAGLARRHRSEEDRRVVYVDITDLGLRSLDELEKPLVELHRAQLGHLSQRELATLNKLLVKARLPHARA